MSVVESPALAAYGVSKTYGAGPARVEALVGVTVELRPGELVALVGPSGSGKSSLLNVLCGWELPDRGSVRYGTGPAGTGPPGTGSGEGESWATPVDALGGLSPSATRPVDRRRTWWPSWSDMAIVPQGFGLLDELSVRENVALPGRFGAGGRATWLLGVDAILDVFGLTRLAGRRPAETSLGEQQRAAVARALIVGSPLVLADEPSAHQDAHWVDAVFGALRAAADRGASCLVATHSAEGLVYADRVVALRAGRVE